ncbi:hypothetical protein R6Z07F_000639 [Ovis aries]
MVKCLPTMWETWVRSLCWEDPLEKEMATYSSTLAWKIPWMEEPGQNPDLSMLLLLLLSRFSRVRLCATPETAAHQAPPSLGFSRQERWSGLPFPSPMHESENEREVAQSCPTLSDPMDCSPPGSSVHVGFARQEDWTPKS